MPRALRSVMPRLAAMLGSRAPGSCAMHSSTGVVGQEAQLAMRMVLPMILEKCYCFRLRE